MGNRAKLMSADDRDKYIVELERKTVVMQEWLTNCDLGVTRAERRLFVAQEARDLATRKLREHLDLIEEQRVMASTARARELAADRLAGRR